MTPQEILFNSLREKGIMRYPSYAEYLKATSRIPESEPKQEMAVLEVLEESPEHKEEYIGWKNEMPDQERREFEYALEERKTLD